MRAEIISIGTELMLGTITDTNASYLAQRLAALGIDCYYVSQVGDNPGRLVAVLRRGWERSDLIVTTGGLGPTEDDLTREAIAALLGEEMVVDPELERHLVSLFARRSWRMPESNKKQATLIPSASAIPNPVGTAPGWWVRRAGANSGSERMIVSMPGVPFEMKRMWEREVEPELAGHSSSVIVSRTLKVMGLGESRVEEVVKELMHGSNPTLAPYAKSDGIHLRLTAKANDRAEAERLIAPLEGQVRSRLGEAIYGIDDETPQGVVANLLDAGGWTFAILEVGDGAIGSVGPLLGAHSACLGVFSGRDIEAFSKNMAGLMSISGEANLEETARGLRVWLRADFVLAVYVEKEPLGNDRSSVRFSTEILLLHEDQDREIQSASYSWRTTPSEVARLVGLAALNHIRHSLLAISRERKQGIAV
ncbi:MAG TPA: CinA family nicotinamide mononucleotide deamidase-related protein [Chloroflexia bacterium]|nr:CinA family nicotinamide mononucleotide deamidase-related protein [Chloroflexia bacterium]